MKFHIFVFFIFVTLLTNAISVSAQADSVIGQITSSPAESFAGGISGDGRLVVFESTGNVATENPRNADGNREIFIFDYAQRRIFQITDTKSLLIDNTKAATFANTRVVISNIRPVMSNDGRWIAFGSNANSITQPSANVTPGNFNASTLTDAQGNNPLTSDANTELWLYQIPAVSPVDLSTGSEIPVTDLSGGAFIRATNTPASFTPTSGSDTSGPIIADDNREASINDDGNFVAFVSTRDLTGGNGGSNVNDEIFTFVRIPNSFAQVTQTSRGTVSNPIYNQSPTISGNGLRVTFLSNADNPIVGGNTGSNADNNVEIFISDLDGTGRPSTTGIRRQITSTTRANPGDIVNILDLGRRMSRDGRYVAFDSYADLKNENGGANYTSFALYLYEVATNTFSRIGPRSDADSVASGGDIAHYPGFTDYDSNTGAPGTLVLETRLNITANGTVATTNDAGLNPNSTRPVQIYSYSLTASSAAFTRLTTFPTPNFFLASVQPITSNFLSRMTFTLGLTEIGTGNSDLANEAFYFLLPSVTTTTTNDAALNFFTGASRLKVSASPVPTPSPSPSPTPITPDAVQGVSPGMLAIVEYGSAATNPPVAAQTAVGSLERRFTLPIQLSGVTLTVNGAAAGIKSVSQTQIVFVVPPGLSVPSGSNTAEFPVVINNNGLVFKNKITIVPVRPDIFTFSPVPGPLGRARLFNVTNRVQTAEPFAVTTLRYRGGRRVPTVLRLYLTGIANLASSGFTIRIGNQAIPSASVLTGAVLREPGVYTVDFTLPPELNGAGDVPVVVSVTINGITYQSRLDDTAPRTRIL